MKKPKITEGEWVVNKSNLTVERRNGTMIVDCYQSFETEFRAKNNAIACSAAPKMIDALMGVYHSMQESRANSGAVYLGDHLESKIEQVLEKAGVEL